jgi:NAD(P)H-hydrate epimerase
VKVADVDAMRSMDSYCINRLGIPGLILMENAALKVVKNICRDKFDSFSIVCSKGNNGGDGFAVARHLYNMGKEVNVFLIGNEDGMSGDCRTNYNIIRNIGIPICKVDSFEKIEILRKAVGNTDLCVDAIFGTGLSRDVEGVYYNVIDCINNYSRYIVSIDLPSGLDGNTGKVLGNCIKADKTVSFQALKKGFLKYDSRKFTGYISIEDIGIPEYVIEKLNIQDFVIDRGYIKSIIKKRDKYGHKGDFGRTLIIAGSRGFSGAAYISTQSAVRSGAGLVTLACREDIRDIMAAKLTEAMTMEIDNGKELEVFVGKSDSVAIGPGMGDNEDTLNILEKTLSNSEKTVVVDADAINCASHNIGMIRNRKCKIVMTPHTGEMSRITGMSIDYIEENRLDTAKKFASKNNVILVLKGHDTIVTDGVKAAINSTGNSAMASGGMGDCLTGMIAGFSAQGYDAFEAACMAVYVHGMCGDRLSSNMFSVVASDVINEIPYVVKDIFS